MSVTKISEFGWLISHNEYIKQVYKDINQQLNQDLFKIFVPYKRKNSNLKQQTSNEFNEVTRVKHLFNSLIKEIESNVSKEQGEKSNNEEALQFAEFTLNKSSKTQISNVIGTNSSTIIKELHGTNFVFPDNCRFFSKDIENFTQYLSGEKFDLILLDPPWWNKYIRRKRRKCNDTYAMLYNHDLKKLPLENHLKNDGLIVIWCTNSPQHLNDLKTDILPKWQVKLCAHWYWVKVTQSLEPVCEFSQPPRKQPYEQLIFARKGNFPIIPNEKIVVSVPSALHSHKPPLIDLLQSFLPKNPKCLEIFARYLMPNWTSYGLEVLKLQNQCFYSENK